MVNYMGKRPDKNLIIGLDVGTSKIAALVGEVALRRLDRGDRHRRAALARPQERRGGQHRIDRAVDPARHRGSRAHGRLRDPLGVRRHCRQPRAQPELARRGRDPRPRSERRRTCSTWWTRPRRWPSPRTRRSCTCCRRNSSSTARKASAIPSACRACASKPRCTSSPAPTAPRRTSRSASSAAGSKSTTSCSSSSPRASPASPRTRSELGVCIIDIGGGTTDLAVFSQGAIRHTAVIPIAGDQVTNDIAVSMRTPTQYAEDIKVRYACALSQLANPDESIEVPSVGDRPARRLARQTLAEVVEPQIRGVVRPRARGTAPLGLRGNHRRRHRAHRRQRQDGRRHRARRGSVPRAGAARRCRSTSGDSPTWSAILSTRPARACCCTRATTRSRAIAASRSRAMRARWPSAIGEFQEVGNIVKQFASDDATVVVGTVIDPELSDEMRVTVVATGLGRPEVAAVGRSPYGRDVPTCRSLLRRRLRRPRNLRCAWFRGAR